MEIVSSHPTLLNISVDAYSHQEEINELRRRLNINHHYFDCWLYCFLENKNFNIEATVEKLERRRIFEKEQLSKYTVTDWIMESMQKGTIQIIGNDKEGRVSFYVVTARDKPTASRREEMRMNFDMMVSYGTRLRADNKRCQMTMLINQDKASVWSNVDMTFQADIALRISKFYPGAIDRIYICNMNRTLAAVAKPIFSRLPSAVSDRMIIISESDIKAGKLLRLFDENVLPVALGGTNNCDEPDTYKRFAVTIRDHYEQLRAAVNRGMSVKEWELETLYQEGALEEQSNRHRINSITGNSNVRNTIDGSTQSCRVDNISGDVHSRKSQSTDLVTCDTFDAYELVASPLNSNRFADVYNFLPSLHSVRRDIQSEYFEQFYLLEGYFRRCIEEAYDREWISVLQRWTAAQQIMRDAENNLESNRLLFSFLPLPVQIILRGTLWISLMVMAFYFLIATVFGALIGCFYSSMFFFSMFSGPYNVFMYGCAFLVTGCQFALFCLHSTELAHCAYLGRIAPPLAGIGYFGIVVQCTICLVSVICFFVVFCVMGSLYGMSLGMQYSLAVGWIVATCLTALYHFLDVFNIFGKSSLRECHSNTSDVSTLYFFLDVDIDEGNSQTRPRDVSLLILSGLVLMVSVVLGLCHIITSGFTYLVTCVVSTFVFALMTVSVINAEEWTSSRGLLICATLYTSVAWLDIVFTTATNGWKGAWGVSAGLLLAMTILTDLIILGYTFVPSRKTVFRRWVFRLSWIWIIAHIVACIILMFIHGYRLALFILALTLHLLMHSLGKYSGPSATGTMILTASFLSLVLVCIFIGVEEITLYSSPASEFLLPDYAKSKMKSNYIPLCLSRFPSRVDIVGMALFAKLVDANSVNVTRTDLSRWFPSFSLVEKKTFSSNSFVSASIFEHKGVDENTTIIALGSSGNLYPAIEATTMWIDVALLSVFSIVTPPSWFVQMIPFVTVIDSMAALLWEPSFDEVNESLTTYIRSIQDHNASVYLVGQGIGGAVAALIAVKAPYNVSAVAFYAPVNGIAWHRGQISADITSRPALSVMPSSTFLSHCWMGGVFTATIPCLDENRDCYDIESIVKSLSELCYHK